MKIYEIIAKQISKTLESYKINKNLLNYLNEPNKIMQVTIPVRINDEFKLYSGYRVQHNNLLGEYKGGLRFNPNVNLDECKALSGWMTYKTALYNLPLGGGKGGVCVNPFETSDEELEKISRNFISLIHQDIGEDKDIPAPDVGTNSKVINWMDDELYQLTGKKNNFTGKSLENRGCNGRTEATGYGVIETLKSWANKNEFDLSKSSYILQGFGNVGSFSADYLNQLGGKLLAVGDHTCYIKDENGIDVNSLIEYNKKHRCIKGFSENEISEDEFWKIKCDIVIPAALELQITEDIAKNLNCNVVLEAANGPLYLEADDVLFKRNIDVLPDILVNSGGVIVSHYEYVQNKDIKNEEDYASKYEILSKLSNQMEKTFDIVYDNVTNKEISYRDASYGVALLNLETKFIKKLPKNRNVNKKINDFCFESG